MSFELPFIKPLAPLYFVGDSNTLLYRYLTLDVPDHFARRIVTNCCFVPALSAASILENGSLNPAIVAFFAREMVIRFKERYVRYAASESTVVDRTWLQTVMPPLQDVYNLDGTLAVTFMIGTIDLGAILANIGTNVDFALDDPRYVGSAFTGPELPIVPAATVRNMIERHFAPFGIALAQMREMGFDEVYVHSLHPPTTDDALYFRARQVMSSAKLRYKVAILINRTLEKLARENGARFLDMWPKTVVGGVVDPRLELDGDHLNRGAVDLTLHALLNDLVAADGLPKLRPR